MKLENHDGSHWLPYPPSANRYWRVWKGRAVKSAEAREYQACVKAMLVERGLRPMAGPVAVELEVVRPARRGDLDNSLKVILDALKGFCYEDDKQVVELHAWRLDNPERPGVRVRVTSRGQP